MYPPAVLLVGVAEGRLQSGLLVHHDEQMRDQGENEAVHKKCPGLIEEVGSRKSKTGTNVHRVANQSIRAHINQSSRRIEWRGRPATGQSEREDAPQRQDDTARSDNYAGDLRNAHAVGPNDPGPGENAAREEHQQETDEEGGVGDRANENERVSLLSSSLPALREEPGAKRW